MAGLLQKPRSILPLLIGGCALSAFLVIMLYGLISGRTGADNQPIPLLKPEVPVKSATDGLHIRPEPHRDITVFDVFDENNASVEEEVNVLSSSEELEFAKKQPQLETQSKQTDITQAPVKPAAEAVAKAEIDVAPIDVKPVDVKPADVKPADVKPDNVKQDNIAPTPKVSATPAVKAPAKADTQQIVAGYYIQLAAFADKLGAENHWNALKEKHQNILAQAPHLVQMWRDTNTDKVFHRLLIGPYDNKQPADDLCDRLQKLSQNCFARRL